MNTIKTFHLYLIQCTIIGLCLLCNYPASAVNETYVDSMVDGSDIIGNANNTTKNVFLIKYSYAAFILTIAAVIVAIPAVVGWVLYYRLRKKILRNDVERATENPQPAMENPQPKKWSLKWSLNIFRLLYNRVKRRKPMYDEENVIEKSQTKPTPSQSISTTRNKDKRKKREMKGSVSKPVGEAVEKPSINQDTNDPVQSGKTPQTPALPKENKVKRMKKKKRRMKSSVNKSVGEAVEMPSIKQDTDDLIDSGLIPQTPALAKENVCIANVIEPEQPCMVPFKDSFTEQQSVPPDSASTTKYKRIVILTWTDEISDEEDDEASTQVEESQKQIDIPMDLKSNIPEAPARDVLPIISKSSPEQISECQKESPVLPQPNLRQAIKPEEKPLPVLETDGDNLMDRLADCYNKLIDVSSSLKECQALYAKKLKEAENL